MDTPAGRKSGTMTEAMKRTEINGTPRINSDIGDGEPTNQHHIRSAPERQQYRERKREPNTESASKSVNVSPPQRSFST